MIWFKKEPPPPQTITSRIPGWVTISVPLVFACILGLLGIVYNGLAEELKKKADEAITLEKIEHNQQLLDRHQKSLDKTLDVVTQIQAERAAQEKYKMAPSTNFKFQTETIVEKPPLSPAEFQQYMKNVIFVSATPSDYEMGISSQIVEQIIRPTGLVDPPVEVQGTKGQMNHLISEIKNTINNENRVLVTTLTKRLAEELSEFLAEKEIKTRYLHAEIDTLERSEIIRQLRLGVFNVLVGINLLREGLDIPEVGFIGILDADKESFLRDYRSLIQIIGRASRNANSKVILYADNITRSMKIALDETNRRRTMQIEYNKKHGITPSTIIKPIKEKVTEVKDIKHIPKKDIPTMIVNLEQEMKEAADLLDFEKAIIIRNRINNLKKSLQRN